MHANPGVVVKADRESANLTFTELLGRLASLDALLAERLGGDYKLPSITTLSRIESGEIAKPSPLTLRAIAIALGKDELSYVRQFRQFRGDGLNVAVAHTIFGAAVFAALPDTKLDGLNVCHFGRETSNGFVPEYSCLASNGHRKIALASFPREEVGAVLRPPALGDNQEYTSKLIFGEDWNAFCLGQHTKTLWDQGLVDVAVASRDIFQAELQTPGPSEAVACANLTRSVRGVSLVALFQPALALAHSNALDLTISDQVDLWLHSLKSIVAFVRSVRSNKKPNFHARTWDRYGVERTYSPYTVSDEREITVLYPKGTFAEDHVRKLCSSVTHPWGSARAREILIYSEPGETCRSIKGYLESEALKTGVALIALWEPYTSLIMYEWDALMQESYPSEFSTFRAAMHEGWQKAADVSPDYICSVENSLGRYLGSIGVQAMPNVSMDVLVRKAILNETSLRRNPKLATLIRFLRVLSDTSLALKQRSLSFATEFDAQTKELTLNAPVSEQTLGKTLARLEDVRIENLVDVLRIPRWRVLRAISEIDLTLRYDAGFLETFLPRRT